MAVELFFDLVFLRDQKKRERTARPEVFTEGHAQKILKKELKILKIKARVILEHSSPIVELKF
jgi:hypothetical protein